MVFFPMSTSENNNSIKVKQSYAILIFFLNNNILIIYSHVGPFKTSDMSNWIPPLPPQLEFSCPPPKYN